MEILYYQKEHLDPFLTELVYSENIYLPHLDLVLSKTYIEEYGKHGRIEYSLSEGGEKAKEALAIAENGIDLPNAEISSIKTKKYSDIIEISDLISKFKKRAQLQKEIEIEFENLLHQTKTI